MLLLLIHVHTVANQETVFEDFSSCRERELAVLFLSILAFFVKVELISSVDMLVDTIYKRVSACYGK